uniref:Secreted protein n=1 Tax=Plectus sambesii TaxID=2011161 RepID=A0A914VSG3_9BILA
MNWLGRWAVLRLSRFRCAIDCADSTVRVEGSFVRTAVFVSSPPSRPDPYVSVSSQWSSSSLVRFRRVVAPSSLSSSEPLWAPLIALSRLTDSSGRPVRSTLSRLSCDRRLFYGQSDEIGSKRWNARSAVGVTDQVFLAGRRVFRRALPLVQAKVWPRPGGVGARLLARHLVGLLPIAISASSWSAYSLIHPRPHPWPITPSFCPLALVNDTAVGRAGVISGAHY